MTHLPTRIRAQKSAGQLELEWDSGIVRTYPFRFLRFQCPCAGCVNEFTGERTIQEADIADGIEPLAMEFSGNYALKIQWSDGHATGLYTWEYLERLAAEPEVSTTTPA